MKLMMYRHTNRNKDIWTDVENVLIGIHAPEHTVIPMDRYTEVLMAHQPYI